MAHTAHLSVSVVIPTYNRARMIRRAVKSALSQCVEGDEVIVVDDGSTDDTQAELAQFGDRIRYIRMDNLGAGAARNRGISESKNELIAFLDSDDEWMPRRLALQRTLLQQREDILFCFSNFAVKGKAGNVTRQYLVNWHRDPRSWDEILNQGIAFSQIAPLPADTVDFNVYIGDLYPSMLTRSYVFTGTVMVRKKAAGDALRFAEDMSTFEDWVCFARLAGAGTAAYIDCETAWQHGHFQPRLTNVDLLNESVARIQTLEKVWGTDSHFLASHGQEYQKILDQQRTILISELLSIGDSQRARDELKKLQYKPLVPMVLALLPEMILHFLLASMRNVKKLSGKT
jgi:Glycosyl transferase family 2